MKRTIEIALLVILLIILLVFPQFGWAGEIDTHWCCPGAHPTIKMFFNILGGFCLAGIVAVEALVIYCIFHPTDYL